MNTWNKSSSDIFIEIGSTKGSSATNVAGLPGNGVAGNGYSQLSSPTDIAVDSDGTMYILDAGNYRVMKWLRDEPLGFRVAGNESSGSALNQIAHSYDLHLDNDGNIYISEYGNHRVSKWWKGTTGAGIVVSDAQLK